MDRIILVKNNSCKIGPFEAEDEKHLPQIPAGGWLDKSDSSIER